MDRNNTFPTQCRLCAFQNALKSYAERADKLFVFQNYPFPRKRWLERSSGSQTFLLEPDAFEKSEHHRGEQMQAQQRSLWHRYCCFSYLLSAASDPVTF